MKFILILLFSLLLVSCKQEKKQNADISSQGKPAAAVVSIDVLAAKSLASKEDWTKDLSIYIDDVMICVRSAPGQTKYVLRADAYENPPVALVILKTESDKLYACSLNENETVPRYKLIQLQVPKNASRFYPGVLPKADSCLNNTKVLDKSGQVTGWLAKITCQ